MRFFVIKQAATLIHARLRASIGCDGIDCYFVEGDLLPRNTARNRAKLKAVADRLLAVSVAARLIDELEANEETRSRLCRIWCRIKT